MHEVALVEEAILTAIEVMQSRGAHSIERLTFALTPGGHVTPEAVQSLFTAFSAGTPAEGAQLAFEGLVSDCTCWQCGQTFRSDRADPDCPACGCSSVAQPAASDLVLRYVDLPEPGFTGR